MDLHFQVNKPSGNDHLFSYTLKGSCCPLTKQAFIKQLALAAGAAGLDPLQGHGIHIGSTLHYLMSGVPMKAIKIKDEKDLPYPLASPTLQFDQDTRIPDLQSSPVQC
jgi:hypothetical protein